MTQPLDPTEVLREDIRALGARPHGRGARFALFAGAALLVPIGLFWAGYAPKLAKRQQLSAAAPPARVALVQPDKLEQPRAITLPGNVQGLEEAAVYARSEGYVVELAADIGDRVSAGQLLARLDDPEVDREIQQARATLASSEAQLVRARAARAHSLATLKRFEALVPGLASELDIEQKRTQAALDAADVGVAEAARDASSANLARLQQIKAFSRVLAPFAGTITARTVERGALVARASQTPLFQIASLDTVRILVRVPQSRVAGIEPGLRARITIAEDPSAKLEGRVTRSAGALEESSRTMRVEVQVANPDHKLLAGMYASVTLELARPGSTLVVPATALIVGEQGARVASVDDTGLVRMLPVQIARDRGADIEIASGLLGGERLIRNPKPGLSDGSVVKAPPRSPR